MDRTDCGIIVGLLLFVVLTSYGSFTVGRYLERRDYLAHFVAQVEAAYYDGYKDGSSMWPK